MRTPPNEGLSPAKPATDAGPERTCVLSRAVRPKDELIRLALSPDGEVAPDVRAKAVGRGAYVAVGRAKLDSANAKGKLKGALSRAFKQDVRVPADLGDRIAAALRQSALDRLGLEARGGTLVTGAERIEQAARAGKVHLLIHAADAGADGNRSLDQAWRVGGGEPQGLVFPEPRTILSMALGRENVVHLALTDPAAARRVRHAIDRWLTFIDPDAGLEGGAAARGDSAAIADEGQE
ncbi:MAG TPA: DUF448 domain-containing protein [Sphingomicrobium sp.]|nr:DUF448 domain-containing protein [Sphingomicrobium sp.]